ncbi:hsp70 family protein [Rhodobacter sp. TJ_12]|uniref:Hsp70 family protein n=1 Tax=Rhodobacter sp. TJ_12 TaxID=2029399 RepID=UPI001CBC6C06|nr:Hsp70 family protein [Rhodobacter sp. TJ_12]MBZ4022827.1 hsp70 family protein [Rhodobacter sp. TJ_12]
MQQTLAVDFGTSNSAVAVWDAGAVRRIPLEDGGDVLPTAVFFPADKGPMLIGSAAATALTEGEEGRYMRALKSVLGTRLFHDARLVGGKRRTLAQVVTEFLRTVKTRAETATGQHFTRALSGRPVHFHADPARDAQAEADLRACYLGAGFDAVDFLFEPEAAARANPALPAGALGLIVDIGGGTSDFSLFRSTQTGVEIVASHGIRLGGTDFDRAIALDHAMPLLGQGGQLRREFGPELLPVPADLYVDLASWAKIPFLYTRETRTAVAKMVKLAVDPRAVGRLATVLEHELGHDLAFAVERGKIEANRGKAGAMIRMGKIERGLYADIDASSMAASLARARAQLTEAVQDTLHKGGVAPDQVGTVVLVGGSSLMGLVAEAAHAICPAAQHETGAAFTAVIDGLAKAIGEG